MIWLCREMIIVYPVCTMSDPLILTIHEIRFGLHAGTLARSFLKTGNCWAMICDETGGWWRADIGQREDVGCWRQVGRPRGEQLAIVDQVIPLIFRIVLISEHGSLRTANNIRSEQDLRWNVIQPHGGNTVAKGEKK